MNWLDIIVLISLLISVVGGLFTGFIHGVISLLGLIVAIVLAGRLYPVFAPAFTFIHTQGWANIASFAAIFLVVMVVTGLIAVVLHYLITSIKLGWLDHLLGSLVGLLTGVLLWGLLLALWAKFFGGGALQQSLIAPVLVDKFPLILALLPPEFDSVRSFLS